MLRKATACSTPVKAIWPYMTDSYYSDLGQRVVWSGRGSEITKGSGGEMYRAGGTGSERAVRGGPVKKTILHIYDRAPGP